MDRGAWWATVHGGAQSRILLKRLSTCLRDKCLSFKKELLPGMLARLEVEISSLGSCAGRDLPSPQPDGVVLNSLIGSSDQPRWMFWVMVFLWSQSDIWKGHLEHENPSGPHPTRSQNSFLLSYPHLCRPSPAPQQLPEKEPGSFLFPVPSLLNWLLLFSETLASSWIPPPPGSLPLPAV